ncbi:MAG TPA: hypothetical protein VN843_30115 [Anaerolineales bacterium]|nr:hypothetical protein [Anaerolineales bacterium]
MSFQEWLDQHPKIQNVVEFFVFIAEVIASPIIGLYNMVAVKFGWKVYQ